MTRMHGQPILMTQERIELLAKIVSLVAVCSTPFLEGLARAMEKHHGIPPKEETVLKLRA